MSSGKTEAQVLLEDYKNVKKDPNVKGDPFHPLAEKFRSSWVQHVERLEMPDVNLIDEGHLMENNCNLYSGRVQATMEFVEKIASALRRAKENTTCEKDKSKEAENKKKQTEDSPLIAKLKKTLTKECFVKLIKMTNEDIKRASRPALYISLDDPVPDSAPADLVVEPIVEDNSGIGPIVEPVMERHSGMELVGETTQKSVSVPDAQPIVQPDRRTSSRKRKAMFTLPIAEGKGRPTLKKPFTWKHLLKPSPTTPTPIAEDVVNQSQDIRHPESDRVDLEREVDLLIGSAGECLTVITECDGIIKTGTPLSNQEKYRPKPVEVDKDFVKKVLCTNIQESTSTGESFFKIVQCASKLIGNEIAFNAEAIFGNSESRKLSVYLKLWQIKMKTAFSPIIKKYSTIPRLIFLHPLIKIQLSKSIEKLQDKVARQTGTTGFEFDQIQSAESNNETHDIKRLEYQVLKVIANVEEERLKIVDFGPTSYGKRSRLELSSLSEQFVDCGIEPDFPFSPVSQNWGMEKANNKLQDCSQDTGIDSGFNSQPSPNETLVEDEDCEFEKVYVPSKIIFNNITEISPKQVALHFYSLLSHLHQKNLEIDFSSLHSDVADNFLHESLNIEKVKAIKSKLIYNGIVSGTATIDIDEEQDVSVSTTVLGTEALKNYPLNEAGSVVNESHFPVQ